MEKSDSPALSQRFMRRPVLQGQADDFLSSVSIEERKPKVRLWKDGKEDTPLNERNPFWADIRIVGGKPAREIPLKDGYFEVTLPRAFFEGNPKAITVGWIDFYRN